MIGALRHRGPEGTGFADDERAALGATRLAIRGLADGRQPLADPETGVLVVCNGEIDNHAALRSWLAGRGRPVAEGTDIAVIPGLYLELGDDFVERLAGAFALAVWDPRRGRLLLARDRAGERPLFYALRGGEVTFATELSAFLVGSEERLELDREALRLYLQFGAFPAPVSPFREIRKVGPAETVAFSERGVERRRYWRWPIGESPERRPAPAEFDRVFEAAVRRQGEADVEFGLFLSGGVDSSLVAATARRCWPERRPPAYTLRFREPSYDEGGMARRVAGRLGLPLTEVWVHPGDFPEQLGRLVRLVGEPLGDPAWVPTALLARRAAEDVKLALVGEGGDELFGGYPTYPGALLAERYARLPPPLRRLVATAVRRWPPSDRKVTVTYLLRRFVEGAELDGVARHWLWSSRIEPSELERLGVRPVEPPASEGEGKALLDVVQRMDLELWLAEGLLTKADRASMSWPLELRAPFLDREVMELAAVLPRSERVRGLTTKSFLKRCAGRHLPREVVRQRKRGLSVPLSGWLRGELHDWARGRLASGALERAGVRSEGALELLRAHVRRERDLGRPLWNLLVLAEWLESLAGGPGAGVS